MLNACSMWSSTMTCSACTRKIHATESVSQHSLFEKYGPTFDVCLKIIAYKDSYTVESTLEVAEGEKLANIATRY
jgi:hypothetical protein